MALDIHKLENGKTGELLFQISDAVYAILEPSFELFRKRTGLFIDPYSDIKFSAGISALICAVFDCAGKVAPQDREIYNEFLAVLKAAELNNIAVVFLGD